MPWEAAGGALDLSRARRERLVKVSAALGAVHKALVAEVRLDWERQHGPVDGTGTLLRLVTDDPFFAWLHALSRLMVEVDELTDRKELDATELAAVRVQIDSLLTDGDFATRYLALLQLSADVVVSHASLRRALGNL